MPSKAVTFKGAFGDTLAAKLELPPDGIARAYALFAHCFTCTKDIFAAQRIAKGLADKGFGVLRFDFTGLGHSAGEFANSNFSSNVDDLVAAAEFLSEHHQAPALLIGHSLGGAAVLAAAEKIPDAKAVATIGAPADPAHVQHLFQEAAPEIEARGEAEVLLAGRPFLIKKQFLEDLEGQEMERKVANLKKALLVFHGPRDETVSIDNAGKIFAAAKHPKSFVSLDDADHLLTRKADALYVAEVLAAWSVRFVDFTDSQEEEAPGDSVVVSENGEGKFGQDVVVGRHRLRADEPRSIGGRDEGPTPYGYLLAGLGACTSMTLRMYADRKGLPLEKVSVSLRHEKIHASDCESCETEVGKIDLIDREITITGDLDASQRHRLLEIADKCPVHRSLENEVKVATKLRE